MQFVRESGAPGGPFEFALDLATMGRIMALGMNTQALSKAALVVASLLLALWAFAPTEALAHAGHSRTVAEDAAPQVKPEQARPYLYAAKREKQGGNQTAAIPDLLQTGGDNSPTLVTSAPARDKQDCAGGCCQAKGPSCCPVFLSAPLASVAPPGPAAIVPHLAERGAGITPGALPEPPKFLM